MTETTVWIDPDGVQYTLEVDWSVSGRFMPKIEFESDGVPGQPGEFFRSVRHGTHEFLMPFDILGTSEADLRTNIRAIMKAMNPTRGFGKVRVTSPLGDQREINCHISSGLEGNEVLGDNSGFTWQRFPATFLAHDPYWYDVSPTADSFAVTSSMPTFFPFFPLKITSSEIAVDDSVTNDGDEAAWPIWTITGPGSVIVLSNFTTGKRLYFPLGALSTGQSITIDTRPGVKSVTYNDGSNAFSALSSDSSLWPLIVGTNTIRLEMSGAVAGVSKLDLLFSQRYLSP